MPENATETGRPAGQLVSEFQTDIEQVQDYEFRVRFDNPEHPELILDAPPPIGRGANVAPSRLLAAAVGHCLASGLLFAARRMQIPAGPISARVRTQIVRNAQGYPRIAGVDVEIDASFPDAAQEQISRLLATFQNFCTVSESIRQGVPISVKVNRP